MEPNTFEVGTTLILSRLFLDPLYKTYVDSMEFPHQAKVLDVGCGSGALAAHLAARLESIGGTLRCVDISRVWLDTARRQLSCFDNVEFFNADATLDFMGCRVYDAAVLHFVLHDIDAQRQNDVLRNVYKSLKPGGYLYLREPVEQGQGIEIDEIPELLRGRGLAAVSQRTDRHFAFGSVYTAVFRKLAIQ